MVFAFSEQLPLAAQRAVSFLPVKVDAGVQSDAGSSVEWRVTMWRVLVPQIPKYLLLGKGYAIDPDQLYIAMLGGVRRHCQAETALVAGDYHSGPLSTIIPLGLWGAIGLLWLLGAGIKVLYQNFRYGDPALHNINTFLLAFFITQSHSFLHDFWRVHHPALRVHGASRHECFDQWGSAETRSSHGQVGRRRRASGPAVPVPSLSYGESRSANFGRDSEFQWRHDDSGDDRKCLAAGVSGGGAYRDGWRFDGWHAGDCEGISAFALDVRQGRGPLRCHEQGHRAGQRESWSSFSMPMIVTGRAP